ncbi:MAG: hemolysin III family protein [Cyclobacteriaceae bacterium]|nr:hemolysin III family protein [Cyclobacteriaceae bacterium HetDA_MAG_MS6]
MTFAPIKYYPRREEWINVSTHLLGLLLSVAALSVLVSFAAIYGTVWHIVSFSFFGSSMVLLYLASTLYHSAKGRRLRQKLNVFDHAAIYVLIAGTYTPFCLLALRGAMGWTLFGIIWGLAVIGIVLKLFFAGKYDLMSTIGYVLMGWVAVIASKSLLINLTSESLLYLILGGASYTIGALFYSWQRLPYNHSIFHVLVLAGSVLHFISIFLLL